MFTHGVNPLPLFWHRRHTGTMTEYMHNPTVDVLLDRRSIRAFQQEPIDPQILTTIEAAAQHAA